MEELTHSEELKIHTKKAHVELEQLMIPLIRSVSTPSQYLQLLKVFYTFYAPLEKRLSKVPGINNLTGDIQLRKADSLYNDIMAIEASPVDVSFCSDLPECTNLSRACGIMYVLEGSVLGGSVIANMISDKMPRNASLPFSFFLYYGDQAKMMWSLFKAKLDSMDNLSRSDVLSAARETFVLFGRWIGEVTTAVTSSDKDVDSMKAPKHSGSHRTNH